MIRAVIFDLDGTLVDHRAAVLAALRSKLPHDGLTDGAIAAWFALERRHMDEFLAGTCSFQEQRRRRLVAWLPSVGEAVPSQDGPLDEWFVGYVAAYEGAWAAYEDVDPCLAALTARRPALRLGVLTNGDSTQQVAKVKRLGLADAFDEVFVSDAIGVAKPDQRAFAIACQRLGVAAAETAFVGDMLAIDAAPATAAGLFGVWLDRSGDGDAPVGVTRIRSLIELLTLVSEGSRS